MALSPQLVGRMIADEEIPLRSRLLEPETVRSIFRYGAVVGSMIERHRRLLRGMDRARRLVRESEESGEAFRSGTVILAEELAAGKGRFQRPWHAPKGGLWMTLVLVNTLLPENNRFYPLAAGAACCETLRHYGVPAHIKWVNDVHVNGKKIAGILTETERGPVHGEEYILIGIGMNVNNEVFPAELAETAVAMQTVLGFPVDLRMLAARLLAKLAWNIGLLHYEEQQHLNLKGINGEETPEDALAGLINGREHLLLCQWKRLSDTIGRRVVFGYDVQKHPQFEAVIQGVDAKGGLILRLPNGETAVEYSGEIVYLD